MSAYMRVCYLLSLIGKTYVLKTQGPGEVAELPHQRLIDAVGSLLFIVEPGHFVALCWITHYCFPMKPCTEMGFQSGMICLAFHMISTSFVTSWICTLIAIAALVAGVVFAAPTLRRRRNDRQGLAAALQMAPIPDQFREQLVNQLPVTHVAPEDGSPPPSPAHPRAALPPPPRQLRDTGAAPEALRPPIHPAVGAGARAAAADAAAGAGLCAICFEEEAESAWRLLPCGHRFHPACVDEWLKKRGGTCPTCRHDPALGETGFTGAAAEDAPPPPLVLSGHAASLTPY